MPAMGCRRWLGLPPTIGCPEQPNHFASNTFVSAGPVFGTRIPNFLETAAVSGFVNFLASTCNEKSVQTWGRRRPPRAVGKLVGSGGSRLQPAVEPGEDGVMPEDAVGRLEHPVVLVGKVEEPAGDSPALESREGGDPLVVRHPVVEAAVDDQRRGLPALDEIRRIELFVVGGALPVR